MATGVATARAKISTTIGRIVVSGCYIGSYIGTAAGVGVVAVAVGSMRCSRYEALAGGGGRELLNSEAVAEAIRPFNSPGEFGARHLHTLSTYANHRIRHGIRHTAALAGRRPRPPVPNDRLRYMRMGIIYKSADS